MAHYFDDMLQRTIGTGTPHTSRMPRVRRSSTARSIGARSDFDVSLNGDDDDDDDGRSVSDSMYPQGDRSAEREEADSHLQRYITEKLNSYRNENEHENSHDEYETKA